MPLDLPGLPGGCTLSRAAFGAGGRRLAVLVAAPEASKGQVWLYATGTRPLLSAQLVGRVEGFGRAAVDVAFSGSGGNLNGAAGDGPEAAGWEEELEGVEGRRVPVAACAGAGGEVGGGGGHPRAAAPGAR